MLRERGEGPIGAFIGASDAAVEGVWVRTDGVVLDDFRVLP